MPIQKNCTTCNKKFTVPPCRESAKYCCLKCRPLNGPANPNWKGGLVFSNCIECGRPTEAKKSHAAKGSGKYCSRTCQAKHSSKLNLLFPTAYRIIKNCSVCNFEIKVKPSAATTQGKYCGKECMAIGYSFLLVGQSNPNFKHGKAHVSGYYIKQRKNIAGDYPKEYPSILYLLQKGKCINCKKDLKGKYHIDHIHPVARGGTNHYWNLQLLCPSCNCRKHAKDPYDWANENGRLL